MFRELLHPSRISAGFIAVLVGYTSSAVIIFQAAAAAGASTAEISSWLWALGLGMGVSTLGLSLYFKQPILTAWSTPGAALLVTGLSGIPMSEAIGAFLFCSVLITLSGVLGLFEKIMRHIPGSLASAMLAGVLLNFGMDLFKALESQLLLVVVMLTTYLIVKRPFSRYVIPLSLVSGLLLASFQGMINFQDVSLEFAKPVFTMPTFSITTLIGIGLPLFIVTMASQNVPGMATLRANGYNTPASPLISWTGFTGIILAPFGGFAFNLAAITAAICMGKEADINPDKRYIASSWAGVFYIITGIFGATVAVLFAAFPAELVMAIAGLALLGTIGNSLAASLADANSREPALLTFLVTASGMSVMGIGSAFWGLLIGLVAFHLSKQSATTKSKGIAELK